MNIIQTEFEGQARGLVESLDEIVDTIVVAGGDGTVSEVMNHICINGNLCCFVLCTRVPFDTFNMKKLLIELCRLYT